MTNPGRRRDFRRFSEGKNESRPKERISGRSDKSGDSRNVPGYDRKEMKMSVKNEKIMVFTGSAEARMFVDSLSEYTDLIYAVVSDQYGSKQHVSGNITVISRYLDKESIKSWVERVGIRVLVDGTEIYAAGASQMIREAAEEMGLEYFKISSRIGVDFTHTSKCAGAADIVRDASYTVGNVLMIGCRELAEGVITEKDGVLKDRVVIVLPPEEENIRICREAGYPPENIICMTMPQPEILMRGLIEGRNITHMAVSAEDISSIKTNLRAAESANIKVSLWGDLKQPEGMTAEELWKIFAERLEIREY